MSRFGLVALAVLIVAIAFGILKKEEGPCVNEDAVTVATDVVVDPCHVFSETYEDARTKFRAAAAARSDTKLYSLPVVGEEYTIDIAVMEGNLDGLVVHTSGVHGAEGYTGSPIQIAWMEKCTLPKENRPPMVLVHAINPYGMAHYRRFDQDNVDLNRNALVDFDAVKMERERNSQQYEPLDESLFAPRRQPNLFDLYIGIFWNSVRAIYKHGYINIKKAMVTGQYSSPKGLFYGGKGLQPSHKILSSFITEVILPTINQDGPVTWIDVHTGLGKIQGMDTFIISGHNNEGRDFAGVFKGASVMDDQVMSGYEWSMGLSGSLYSRLFNDAWVFEQEFGTVNTIMVARALVLENMARQNGSDSDEKWSALLRSAFYPRNANYRRLVLIRGWTVLTQAVERNRA